MSWYLKLYQITYKCYPSLIKYEIPYVVAPRVVCYHSLIKNEVPYVVAPQVVPDNICMLPFVDRIVWFLFSLSFFL